ncbi:MAG: IS30 family transposase [Spirochaetia bacterium]|nr:IS30 family transposase [Spirochaetia bacterium]
MRPKNSHLNISERYVISNMLGENKFTLIDIGKAIDRDSSVISREIKRNSDSSGYKPDAAQKRYYFRKLKTVYQKTFNENIFNHFREELKKGISPDVIAGKLRTSKDKTCHVSTQTIYNWIYKNRFGAGLTKFLLFGKHRYKKSAEKLVSSGKKRVEEMPKCARNRKRLGDFEGDTIIGAKQKGALITLIDRKSLYIFADVLENKMAETFSKALRDLFADLNTDKLKSLLFDNGTEMSMWKSIKEMLQIPVYFTHPGRPWEKPLIENANRMLRRFFPKKMQLDKVTSEEVLHAVTWLNNYPRKSLNYRTPYEVFFKIKPIAFAF